ncbi:MAG: hypothetical protein Q8916_05280 [Bacteroidota bacterium]|nr:hypothetical protein [Bacteroidota bacterium]MDP4229801.1 hypothetical protein [Bacteroidota bacterium]MDP4236297.1 hypothetical protein [Bacteroidota bacterium]
MRIIAIYMFMMASVSSALGQMPRAFFYQAEIRNSDGSHVKDSVHLVTFTLYDAASGGNVLFTQTGQEAIRNGILSAAIGRPNPLPDSLLFTKPYYLGISIDTYSEIQPRTALNSAPYSLHSALTRSLTQDAIIAPEILPKFFPAIGPAGGDLIGSYPSPKVVALQSKPVANISPTINSALQWNDSVWTPTPFPGPVAFHVFGSGESIQQVGSYYPIKSYDVNDPSCFNYNNDFEISRGTFIVPRSGIYHFDAYLKGLPNSPERIALSVDGNARNVMNFIQIGSHTWQHGELGQWQYSVTIALQAGQKVQLVYSPAITDLHADFSGFRIR